MHKCVLQLWIQEDVSFSSWFIKFIPTKTRYITRKLTWQCKNKHFVEIVSYYTLRFSKLVCFLGNSHFPKIPKHPKTKKLKPHLKQKRLNHMHLPDTLVQASQAPREIGGKKIWGFSLGWAIPTSWIFCHSQHQTRSSECGHRQHDSLSGLQHRFEMPHGKQPTSKPALLSATWQEIERRTPHAHSQASLYRASRGNTSHHLTSQAQGPKI